MTLPTVTGIGFLISDGVDMKVSQGGKSYARLPLVFKNTRKDSNGAWTHDKEILIEATAFGPLAEYLSQEVTGRTDLAVTGTIHMETYRAKDGSDKQALRMTLASASPAGPDRAKASVGSSSRSDDSDVPF